MSYYFSNENEKETIIDKKFEYIKELTQANNHTEALWEGIKFIISNHIEDSLMIELKIKCQKLLSKHNRKGYLSPLEIEEQLEINRKLMRIAKVRLSEKRFNHFSKCF